MNEKGKSKYKRTKANTSTSDEKAAERLARVSRKKPRKQKNKTPSPSETFRGEIERFVIQMESLAKSLDLVTSTLEAASSKSAERFGKFIHNKQVKRSEGGGEITVSLRIEDLPDFKHHFREFAASALAMENTPRIFFCALVHQYDAYLGKLLRTAFYARPELVNGLQRTLTFEDLVRYTSIEDARDSVVEKEVESVIRESHTSQFDWMESRFGLELRKDLRAWPAFVELTERRNLFVHCDGIVSSQYLSVCRRHGAQLPKGLKAGNQLHVTRDYFDAAFECVFEIGVKLGQVLWRKLMPDDLKRADSALHDIGYELLLQERYSLVKTLMEFATVVLKRHSSDRIRRVNRINLAIAHKYSGDSEVCRKTLAVDDWSASSLEFHLAVAVLEERYSDATDLMREIGSRGCVTKQDYASWPLFRDFRKTEAFSKTYRELFGDDFVLRDDSIVDRQIETPLPKS